MFCQNASNFSVKKVSSRVPPESGAGAESGAKAGDETNYTTSHLLGWR
jgi:hypothetical protein